MMYVIAGTEPQAYEWINEEIQERINNGEPMTSIQDYQYVHSVDVLRGAINPRGIFVGTWYERKDMNEIFQTLLTRMTVNSGPWNIVQNTYKEWMGGSFGRE
jgi:hypothetical protein